MPPKFTKKHYLEIARLLGRTPMNESTRQELVLAFTALFQGDNDGFDFVRFQRAVEKEHANDR